MEEKKCTCPSCNGPLRKRNGSYATPDGSTYPSLFCPSCKSLWSRSLEGDSELWDQFLDAHKKYHADDPQRAMTLKVMGQHE